MKQYLTTLLQILISPTNINNNDFNNFITISPLTACKQKQFSRDLVFTIQRTQRTVRKENFLRKILRNAREHVSGASKKAAPRSSLIL